MTQARAVWICVCVAAAACSKAHPRGEDDDAGDDVLSPSDDSADDGSDDVDAPPLIDLPDAEPHNPGDPDASPSVPVTATLSQTADNTNVTIGNSVSCHDEYNVTAENSYYRAYVLAEHGISTTFSITGVTVGVENTMDDPNPETDPPQATQPAAIRLYSYPGAPGTTLDVAQMTGLGSSNVTFTNGLAGAVVNFPVTATVPPGATLIVEVAIPDGDPDGDQYGPHFFIGSNTGGETRSGYLRAPECGTAAPSQLSALGFGTMHMIINVTGSYLP
jgi:hypothetical protein